MTSPVIVRAAAKEDIRKARNWYQNIAPHLGEDFLAAVDHGSCWLWNGHSHIKSLNEPSDACCFIVSRTLSSYHAGEDRIVVVAVLHQARDPQLLEQR